MSPRVSCDVTASQALRTAGSGPGASV